MSKRTETREERDARYERGEVDVSPRAKIYEGDEGGITFDDLDLSPAERERFDRLARVGRPRLSGSTGQGRSPKRQVRLPIDLNQELDARAKREHRSASDILRDALTAYLDAS